MPKSHSLLALGCTCLISIELEAALQHNQNYSRERTFLLLLLGSQSVKRKTTFFLLNHLHHTWLNFGIIHAVSSEQRRAGNGK